MAGEDDTTVDEMPDTTDFNELWDSDDIPDDPDEEGDDDDDDEDSDGDEDDVPRSDSSAEEDDEEDEDDEDPDEEDEDEEDADDDVEDDDEPDEEDLEEDLKKAAAKAKKATEGKGKIWKIPVDGVIHEATEEQLVREYGTAISSSQRFQESKQMREEAGEFFREYTGPKGFDALVEYHTPKLGSRTLAREHVRDMALEWLAPDLEGASITDPREKALYEERRRINDEKIELDRTKKAEASARAKRQKAKFLDDLASGIRAGMKKHELPTDKKEIWNAIGSLIDTALQGGAKREDVVRDVEGFVEKVAATRHKEAKALIPTLSKKELEKMFPEQAKELKEGGRKDRVAKVRGRRKKKKAGAASSKQRRRSGKKEPQWVELHDAFD